MKLSSVGFFRLFQLLVTAILLHTSISQASFLHLPVQNAGRVKPFDTFARESLHLVWGKETFHGKPAADVVFSWMLIPGEWEKSEIVQVRHHGLRQALVLDDKRLYYTPSEVIVNQKLGLLIQELKNKREAQEKLDPFYQAVQTLENQLTTYQAIKLGLALRVMPAEETSAWKNVTELTGKDKEAFDRLTQAFIEYAAASGRDQPEVAKQARKNLDDVSAAFVSGIEDGFPGYASKQQINAEVHLNSFNPFRWAWVSYLLALIFFSFAHFGTKQSWLKPAWGLTGLALVLHSWGFGLRIYILERPPVSNMFETVVWVALVAVLFAIVLYKYSRSTILPLAATMVATLALILCDISSSVLDDSLTPLEPVLRDNFWLLNHVIIIVSSYAAFFLAFFLGDILLFYHWKDEKKYAKKISEGAAAIYRSIQIGVVLLAAGTILGGVWADYSWGRFWGWDPKETWAFIALLGYLVILHGRLVGWLRNFGLAAASVVAFSLVIMAWYGVNFVLGAGLHTYGFGAGGVEYVSAFVAGHLLFVAYVTTLRQNRLKSLKS